MIEHTFEVWIKCSRGIGHTWRKLNSFATQEQAQKLIDYHKEIDAKPPRGHYLYDLRKVKEENETS